MSQKYSSIFPAMRSSSRRNSRRGFCRGIMRQHCTNITIGKGIGTSWNWDLNYSVKKVGFNSNDDLIKGIASSDISRIDLIIRWGGRRRLSGFLPIQSMYADIYVLDELWPDYNIEHVYQALE